LLEKPLSQLLISKLLPTSHLLLTQENNGQNVIPLKKSEINVIVDLVGLSELLKLCPIESVLPQDKPNKQESLLKIYLNVVKAVDKDVKEVTLKLLGNILPTLVSSLETYMLMTLIVNHISLLHAIHISTVLNTQIAQLNTKPPQDVSTNVTLNIQEATLVTKLEDNLHIQFKEYPKSKPNS